MGSVMDINKLYPYITTFNLINITITNIAINTGRLWRRPVLGQSEIVCTVAVLDVQCDTAISLCSGRRRALAFRRGALDRAARAHIVERTSVYDNGADTLPTKLPGQVKSYFRPAKTPATPISKVIPAVFRTFAKYMQLRTKEKTMIRLGGCRMLLVSGTKMQLVRSQNLCSNMGIQNCIPNNTMAQMAHFSEF